MSLGGAGSTIDHFSLLALPRGEGWGEQLLPQLPNIDVRQRRFPIQISNSLNVIASQAKQSRTQPRSRTNGLLRRFRLRSLSYGGQAAPRNDGVIETCLRHLAARCPSCAGAFGPRKTEGAGKAGRPLHPQPRVRKLKAHERSHHRFTGTTRPSLRNGFNGLFRALPGDRAFLSPSPARLSADLTPASRRQDHTILPSAGPRPRQKRSPASTASRPASVTIAIRPSSGAGRRES
jgi:hypothetical protein